MAPGSTDAGRNSSQSGGNRSLNYGGVAKRSSNACKRCRRQKIKCSGRFPCHNCTRKKLTCDFDDQEQKVLVTKGYLGSLHDHIARLEQKHWVQGEAIISDSHVSDSQKNRHLQEMSHTEILLSGFPPNHDRAAQGDLEDQEDHGTQRDSGDEDGTQISRYQAGAQNPGDHDSEPLDRIPPLLPHSSSVKSSPVELITNPLSTGPSAFTTSESGRTLYLGTSSNWSFTRQITNMTYEHIHKTPIPSKSLLFDCETYDLEMAVKQSPESAPASPIPTVDYAVHLVNSVKFHCGQLLHLYDEEEFMEELFSFYSQPEPRIPRSDLWYVHFLLIVAFGKAFVTRANGCGNRSPPGAVFFTKALNLLSTLCIISKEPVEATEVLCCMALYLQSVDHRNSAYIYIGQAIRLAMSYGLHMDVPALKIGERLLQRRRKVWWTTLVLDREMTSLMGLPQFVYDSDVHTSLPVFSSDPLRTQAFTLRTKLCFFIASINRSLYGLDGRQDGRFLRKTKEALSGLAGLTDELHQKFPLSMEGSGSGMSRLSGHLHLTYHQCIVLATRPLLFFFWEVRLQSPASCMELLDSSPAVKNLVHVCLESSQYMLAILGCLQDQGLLETFLSFDLEALFISTISILIAPALHDDLQKHSSTCRSRAFALFEEMTRSGNLVAKLEDSELRHLDQMLNTLPGIGEESTGLRTSLAVRPEGGAEESHQDDSATVHARPTDQANFDNNFGDDINNFGLSAAQIMDMADAIEDDETQWMSEALLSHAI